LVWICALPDEFHAKTKSSLIEGPEALADPAPTL
jgi:hypothetical protein